MSLNRLLKTQSITYPQKKNSKGMLSGHHAGQVIGPPLPIHLPENCWFTDSRTRSPKWGGAPSCWKITCWTSYSCGKTNDSSIWRKEFCVTKKGSNDLLWSSPQHTSTFGAFCSFAWDSWITGSPDSFIMPVDNSSDLKGFLLIKANLLKAPVILTNVLEHCVNKTLSSAFITRINFILYG